MLPSHHHPSLQPGRCLTASRYSRIASGSLSAERASSAWRASSEKLGRVPVVWGGSAKGSTRKRVRAQTIRRNYKWGGSKEPPQLEISLERVFHAKFDDAVTELVLRDTPRWEGCGAKRRLQQVTVSIEVKFHVGIAGCERSQRMIEEVEPGDPELQALMLSDPEVLGQSQIGIPEHRPNQVRQVGCAVLPRDGGSKARGIEELNPGCSVWQRHLLMHVRVANDGGVEIHSICSHGADLIVHCDNVRSRSKTVLRVVQVRVLNEHIRSALHLSHAGNLPAIGCPAQERIAAV